MLEISSGLIKGLQLRSPQGRLTRPSSLRLRQGTFNVLRHFRWKDSIILDQAIIIDLFAGTGAWGIEALSNGAGEVWFIESNPTTFKLLEHNVGLALRCFEKQGLVLPVVKLLKGDVLQWYPRLPVSTVIFCDPPYKKGWFEKVDHLELRFNRLENGGVFLYESDKMENLPHPSSNLREFDSKIYGDSVVHFFVKSST